MPKGWASVLHIYSHSLASAVMDVTNACIY